MKLEKNLRKRTLRATKNPWNPGFYECDLANGEGYVAMLTIQVNGDKEYAYKLESSDRGKKTISKDDAELLMKLIDKIHSRTTWDNEELEKYYRALKGMYG